MEADFFIKNIAPRLLTFAIYHLSFNICIAEVNYGNVSI